MLLDSEEKAKLLRLLGEDVESKNTDLAVFMASMGLEDGEVPEPGDHIGMPQELIEVAAALSVRTDKGSVLDQLKGAMASIASVSSEVESSLREIGELLAEDRSKEEELAAALQVGGGEGRQQNLVEEVERECKKYLEAHKMASDSNAILHSAIKLHLDNLAVLTLPLDELQTRIPSLADLDEKGEANIAEVGTETPVGAAVHHSLNCPLEPIVCPSLQICFHFIRPWVGFQLKKMLRKVDEMKTQREMLVEQLRQEVMDDDITKKLVVHKDKELSEIFELEIQKHTKSLKVIHQNLAAQDNILDALTDVNAK